MSKSFHVMSKPIGPICNLDCTYCYYLSKEQLLDDPSGKWRMTYEILASRTGLAKGTLQNFGGSRKQNANLSTIARICGALGITPGDLLELIEDPPKSKRGKKKTRKR